MQTFRPYVKNSESLNLELGEKVVVCIPAVGIDNPWHLTYEMAFTACRILKPVWSLRTGGTGITHVP